MYPSACIASFGSPISRKESLLRNLQNLPSFQDAYKQKDKAVASYIHADSAARYRNRLAQLIQVHPNARKVNRTRRPLPEVLERITHDYLVV